MYVSTELPVADAQGWFDQAETALSKTKSIVIELGGKEQAGVVGYSFEERGYEFMDEMQRLV